MEFEGIVESLDCAGGEIVVTPKDDDDAAGPFTVEVASATIRDDAMLLACSDLRVGDRVQVRAETSDGSTLVERRGRARIRRGGSRFGFTRRLTAEMLERARANAAAAGHRNVEFRAGRIEALPVADASVDAVISNCVINLVPDKPAVYREVARVLRPDGRMVVSDVVLDAPLPAAIAASVAALTGCVAGAALRGEYLDAIGRAGLADIEILRDQSFGEMALGMIPEDSPAQQARAAGIDVEAVARSVRSLTIRARKPGP